MPYLELGLKFIAKQDFAIKNRLLILKGSELSVKNINLESAVFTDEQQREFTLIDSDIDLYLSIKNQ